MSFIYYTQKGIIPNQKKYVNFNFMTSTESYLNNLKGNVQKVELSKVMYIKSTKFTSFFSKNIKRPQEIIETS